MPTNADHEFANRFHVESKDIGPNGGRPSWRRMRPGTFSDLATAQRVMDEHARVFDEYGQSRGPLRVVDDRGTVWAAR